MRPEIEYFDVGRISSAHGVRGEVSVQTLSDVPGRLDHLKDAWLRSPDQRQTKEVRLSCRPHKQGYIARLDGVTDRDQAELLRGWYISITRQQAHPLPSGRYFVRDLVGLRVVDEALGDIGEVKDVLKDTVQDIYVVSKAGEADVFFPAVKEILLDILPEEGQIKVRLPRGLVAVYRPGVEG